MVQEDGVAPIKRPRGGHDIVAAFEDGIDLLNLRAYSGVTVCSTTIVAQGLDTLVAVVDRESTLLAGIDAANAWAQTSRSHERIRFDWTRSLITLWHCIRAWSNA